MTIAAHSSLRERPPETVDDFASAADYIDVSWGQAHRLSSVAPAQATAPTLYAFHGTAYSGRSFIPLMRGLPQRSIAALDTPGYGASTRPTKCWPLARYAAALAEAIDRAGDTRIDLLGYHTGALIAVLVAAARPDLVRRLILIGVPYFPDADERQIWRDRLAHPMQLSETLDQFQERWNYLVAGRAPGASLSAGFGHFVDELRAWPYGYWAHDAAFASDPTQAFDAVTQPTLVLNPATPLAEASRRAGKAIRRADVVELPHLTHGVLDVAAEELGRHINAFLAEDLLSEEGSS